VLQKKIKTVIIFLTGLLVLCGAAAFAVKERTSIFINGGTDELENVRGTNPYNWQLVDSGIRVLRTGDVVIRTGGDVTSYMFSQMNQTEKTYSHCGIVIVESGFPFVYHSIGGEDNPDQVLRRDSASFWFSPSNNLGFGVVRYDLDSIEIASLILKVKQNYRDRKKFDMDFDLQTDDRLYCAEFVYKAINEATKDSGYIQPVTVLGYTFVGIDNLFHNSHAKLICQLRFK
jgi:hypothetical protein